MRRALVLAAGALGGLTVASMLPIWPLVYGDLGRNTSFIEAYRLPNYIWSFWIKPLLFTAALIAFGETLARRVFEFLEQRKIGRRLKLRQCTNCAYSLTGNVSGVRPECGTPVAKAADIERSSDTQVTSS